MNSSRFAPVLMAVVLSNVAFLGTASAQDAAARDYYLARGDRAATQALNNVERFHYEPAVKSIQARRYQYAQADLEFILKYFPNHPQALARIGEVSIALRRPDIAEDRFNNAIGRYPQHDETYVIHGIFLHKLGRIERAITEYKRALDINPASAFGHYNLALAYVERNDYVQANVHAQQAYALGVTFPGLKRKLQAAGAWKVLEGDSTKLADPPPSANPEGERKAE
jgi:tetratricopeptide (TPR) repeat protein